MFIKLTRNGSRTYLQIAESYRDPKTGKPRQRHIANLGRLDNLLKGGSLNTLLEGLLEATGQSRHAVWADPLTTDTTAFETARGFGSTWVVSCLWKQLKLDRFFERRLKHQEHPSAFLEQRLRAMVMYRLCASPSTGRFAEWAERTYLPDLEETEIDQQQLLSVLDALFPLKNALEKHLTSTFMRQDHADTVLCGFTTLFVDDRDTCVEPPSKDLSVTAEIALTSDGFPLKQDINEGIINLPTALTGLVPKLRPRFPGQRLILLADLESFSSDIFEIIENLTHSKKRPVEYIVGVPAHFFEDLKATTEPLSPQWEATSRAQGGEVVESVTLADGRRLLIARHPERIRHARRRRVWRLNPVLKLAAILERQLESEEENTSSHGPRLTDAAAKVALSKAVAEARASRFIHIDHDEPTFTWWWDVAALKHEQSLDGALILVSNVSDMAAPDLVNCYQRLSGINQNLNIRHNQLEIASLDRRRHTRVQEHALISYLALVIRQLLGIRLRRRGLDLSADQALKRLDAIQCHTMRLSNNRRVKYLSQISSDLQALFEAIGVEIPTSERLT